MSRTNKNSRIISKKKEINPVKSLYKYFCSETTIHSHFSTHNYELTSFVTNSLRDGCVREIVEYFYIIY